MRDLLGGKGAGLAEMTIAGLPDPARLHDHDRGLQRLLRGRRAAAGRAVGRRPRRRPSRSSAAPARASATRQPAPRQRPLGRQVLDARDDGHGPQPRPQRGDAPRADRADRQRALRLGRVPAVHPDVRPDRHGGLGRALRPRARGLEGGARRRAGHRPRCRGAARARHRVQGRSSRPTPAATSPRTRTSSWTSRSRRCSRSGSASAPATTARTRASPTTSARPSTS